MGSALNVGYGLQWPVFAIFFGVMWWRMLNMELRRARGEDVDAVWDEVPAPVEVPEPRPDPAYDGPSPFGPRPISMAAVVEHEDDPELASYNNMLAQLSARDTRLAARDSRG